MADDDLYDAAIDDARKTAHALRNVPALINDGDWEHIFANYTRAPDVRDKTRVYGPYARKDVVAILAVANGERDGASWAGVFEMMDGRFVAVTASCDYTGWGCQESGAAVSADTAHDVVTFGLSVGDRDRLTEQLAVLNLTLRPPPGDPGP